MTAFMTIPPEIRERIYKLLFVPNITICIEDTSYGLSKIAGHTFSRVDSAILRVSKFVHNEAAQIYHRHQDLHYQFFEHFLKASITGDHQVLPPRISCISPLHTEGHRHLFEEALVYDRSALGLVQRSASSKMLKAYQQTHFIFNLDPYQAMSAIATMPTLTRHAIRHAHFTQIICCTNIYDQKLQSFTHPYSSRPAKLTDEADYVKAITLFQFISNCLTLQHLEVTTEGCPCIPVLLLDLVRKGICQSLGIVLKSHPDYFLVHDLSSLIHAKHHIEATKFRDPQTNDLHGFAKPTRGVKCTQAYNLEQAEALGCDFVITQHQESHYRVDSRFRLTKKRNSMIVFTVRRKETT